jgi:osmotically inducible protein OsmC
MHPNVPPRAARGCAGPDVRAEVDPRPVGGCFGILIVGYPATACLQVPSGQSGHPPDWSPVITIRYLTGPAVSRAIADPEDGAEMARVLYTAEATVTGGRASGHGRTNDGALDVQIRSPKEMGGEGGGTNPEQLFAVGYAACFESALGVVGRRERAEVGDVSIDSRVSLLPTEERGFKLAVELDVTLPQVQDPEQADRIVAAAHQVCPYSNATRGNIDVTLTVNGRDIG